MEQNKKSMDVTSASSDASSKETSTPSKEKSKEKSSSTNAPQKRAADRAKVAKGSKSASGSKGKPKKPQNANPVRQARIERMMSKAELARRAGLSVLTIDRVEKGLGCRMDTKRKILEALGLSLADRVRVFGEEE